MQIDGRRQWLNVSEKEKEFGLPFWSMFYCQFFLCLGFDWEKHNRPEDGVFVWWVCYTVLCCPKSDENIIKV